MLRPYRKRAGFTLLEMVVVLGVIGTLAAMAMPSIVNGVWQQRQGGAAQDLVRFLRGVRDLTRRSGVAHNVVFNAAAGELGLLEVWMGANNHCRLTDWAFARANRGPNLAQGHAPVMVFDMVRYNPFGNSTVPAPGGGVDTLVMRVRTVQFNNVAGVRLTSPTQSSDLSTGEVCFEPAGDVYFRQPAATTTLPVDVMAHQSQLVQFAVIRIAANSSSSVGVDRHVILSPSGVARIRQ